MKVLRLLLLPISLIYWMATSCRNLFYNFGYFKSFSYSLPIIAIGNLSTGGTGKTPQTEYLIRLLSSHFSLATLSRGYKRKSKGFVLADKNANADILGDEPYQFASKFSTINVAVDVNRKNGIEQLIALKNPKIILLDDAYQHRRVKAGFYILLTAYGDLYSDDYILPAGNLREGRSGAKRANIIVVTKCPPQLSTEEQHKITNKLKPLPSQKVFFTSIEYDAAVYNGLTSLDTSAIKNQEKVLVAGIAKPKPFFDFLSNPKDIIKSYPDHHNFNDSELLELNELAKNKIIITTEKDYMRLKGKVPLDKLFYLPIKSNFISKGDDFDSTILNYVNR
ncbi:tetraacyldisaccharide 4'-kinase [Flavobacterium zepuense]|uniref:Tetraacyldisaccharide 4'-kinase n=1 Tax=Flavobacterium zepuense TaxID=2593302 RepID=A0A552V3S6_9FLAO|nr:tetraacyldisaccharide 4'-kinase [Flavobacterium zepuense]TRW25097.1 tetraacyldisaccharide 4'-kinase [Flavobacterium zepuense]